MSKDQVDQQRVHKEADELLHLGGKSATADRVQRELAKMPDDERAMVIKEMEAESRARGEAHLPQFIIQGITNEIVREAKDPNRQSIAPVVDALSQDRDGVTRALEQAAAKDHSLHLREKQGHLVAVDVEQNGVTNTVYQEGIKHKIQGVIGHPHIEIHRPRILGH